MRKWEEKYNELKSGKLDTKIEELQAKEKDKTITMDELKELKKSNRLKENIAKVDNILEYKNRLANKQKELQAEQDRRQSLINLEKEATKLNRELENLNVNRTIAERRLKMKELSDEQKAQIQAELGEIKSKIAKNQENFSNNQLTIAATSKISGRLTELSDDELAGRKTKISTNISKCNMICAKLMEGYSWDSIDIKLAEWKDRKLTAKKGTAEQLREAVKEDTTNQLKETVKEDTEKTENIDVAKVEEALKQDSVKTTRKVNNTNITNTTSIEQNNNSKNTSLVEVSEFDKKHPRIAKLKNFFKNIGKGLKNIFIEEDDTKKPKKEKKTQKVAKSEVVPDKDEKSEKMENNKKLEEEKAIEEVDNFREYIKIIAEKGITEASREMRPKRLATIKENNKEQIEENKDANKEER